MKKPKPQGMQKESAPALPIEGIPHHRMPNGPKMQADLMGSSSSGIHQKQGFSRPPRNDPKFRNRFLSEVP
jgi:hypothetical protein